MVKFLTLFTLLVSGLTLNGQQDHKSAIEFNFDYIKMHHTNFLQMPKYQGELKARSMNGNGFLRANSGNNFELGVKYVFQINEKTGLVSTIEFIERNEEATTYCNFCTYIPVTIHFLKANNLDFGLGIRHTISEWENLILYIEPVFNFPILQYQKEASYSEIEMNLIAKIWMTELLGIKMKLGYERSIGTYTRGGFLFGVGLSRWLNRKKDSF